MRIINTIKTTLNGINGATWIKKEHKPLVLIMVKFM